MLRLRRSFILSIVGAAALLPASDAAAASSAQRFADAVERGKAAIRAKEPAYRAAFAALDWPRCEGALERVASLPRREERRFMYFLTAAMLDPLMRPSLPVLEQIVADLDAIPTNDRALKSGRAAWRESVAFMKRYPLLDKPCEQLDAWADSRWQRSVRPAFDVAAFERLLQGADDDESGRKLARAARRMRRLGVSKGDATRFEGETIFDDVPAEIRELTLEGLEPEGGPRPRSPRAAGGRARR